MRKVTIALVIACAILALFTLSFYSYLNELTDEYDSLTDEHNSLVDEYNELVDEYVQTLENFQLMIEELAENLENALEGAKLPPYIVIENRDVDIVFKASDGTLHRWSVPLESFETSVKMGYYKREIIPEMLVPMMEKFYDAILPIVIFAGGDPADYDYPSVFRPLGIQYVDLSDNETGEIHHLIDFRPFIVENNFEEVMTNLYHDLGNNDEDFVYEVWFIVTQLTTYSSELEETPRFPLETMIGGGGDCEDMAILIASMLKAAPVDYVVKLVYMDADNPTEPQEVNHVIVWVETPSGYETFVEGTSKVIMNPFTEVEGWYFEV